MVEHFLGKEEVVSSILINSSRTQMVDDFGTWGSVKMLTLFAFDCIRLAHIGLTYIKLTHIGLTHIRLAQIGLAYMRLAHQNITDEKTLPYNRYL